MHFSKLYLQQNFVPDIVADQFGRKVIGVEVSLTEGENLKEAEENAKNYIKEYIEKNTVYHSSLYTEESLPPEPAVLPSIQVKNEGVEMSLLEQIENCPNLEILKSYKLISKQNILWGTAYHNKFDELLKLQF